MVLVESIKERQEELAQKWAELILGTYPEQTQTVWRANRDRFSNPVGHAIITASERLMGLLLTWDDPAAVAKALEEIVKIRAVQDFTPGQALSFVYLLKKLLRAEFLGQLKAEGRLEELLGFETRIDNLALLAFEIYVGARDQIARMRVEEVKRAHANIVRRANLMTKEAAAQPAE